MKLPKFLLILGLLTTAMLFYVRQQTQIFCLAYAGQKHISLYQDLLDKNTVLRYNIARSASLVHIGKRVLDNKDFEIPTTYRLVRLEVPAGLKLRQYALQRQTLLSRLFGIKREAEAMTINPQSPLP